MLFNKYRPVLQLKQLLFVPPSQVKHVVSHNIQLEHVAVVHELTVVM